MEGGRCDGGMQNASAIPCSPPDLQNNVTFLKSMIGKSPEES